jgi:hypothetical protein
MSGIVTAGAGCPPEPAAAPPSLPPLAVLTFSPTDVNHADVALATLAEAVLKEVVTAAMLRFTDSIPARRRRARLFNRPGRGITISKGHTSYAHHVMRCQLLNK